MILSDITILERMAAKTIERDWFRTIQYEPNPARIEIEPFIESDLQGASVDLRLGDEIIWNGAKEVLGSSEGVDDVLLLPPGGTCLAATSARIHIPYDCVGRVEGKSSIGRQFVVIHCTAGWLDPGFDGYITLELANLSKLTSFLLERNMPICQITFIKMDQPAQRQYKGKYQNAKGVEAHKR